MQQDIIEITASIEMMFRHDFSIIVLTLLSDIVFPMNLQCMCLNVIKEHIMVIASNWLKNA
jgi:hypothetical protein